MSDQAASLSLGPDACLCLSLRKAARVVTRAYDAAMAPHGLTIGQFSILAHIHAKSGYTQSALAEALAMDQSSLSRALGPLERDGLIAVERDAADSRKLLLAVTPPAREKLAAARESWSAVQRQLRQHVGNAEVAELMGMLGLLRTMPGGHERPAS